MPFTVPVQAEIRDDILGDWRNLDDQVVTAVDSDNYVRASGFASAVEGLYQFAAWGINQFFPDTADIESTDRRWSIVDPLFEEWIRRLQQWPA